MAFLFRCDDLTKSFGPRRLFTGISISFEDGERTGLIGPNGSGKSTLMKILAGLEHPDEGTLTNRRGLKLGYVSQADQFAPGATPRKVLQDAIDDPHAEEHDRQTQAAILLDRVGFADPDQPVDSLSGGWKKRLSIARQLIQKPDVVPARRADEPPRPGGDRMAGAGAVVGQLRVPGRQPRPVLPGADDEPHGRVERRLRRRLPERVRPVQRLPHQEERVSGRPVQPGVQRGRPGSSRAGMAEARRKGPHHQGQGAHPAGRATGQSAGRPEDAERRRRAGAAGLRWVRTADAQADVVREGVEVARRARLVPQRRVRPRPRHEVGIARAQRRGQDDPDPPDDRRPGARRRHDQAGRPAEGGRVRPVARRPGREPNVEDRTVAVGRIGYVPRGADPRVELGRAGSCSARSSWTCRSTR